MFKVPLPGANHRQYCRAWGPIRLSWLATVRRIYLYIDYATDFEGRLAERDELKSNILLMEFRAATRYFVASARR